MAATAAECFLLKSDLTTVKGELIELGADRDRLAAELKEAAKVSAMEVDAAAAECEQLKMELTSVRGRADRRWSRERQTGS